MLGLTRTHLQAPITMGRSRITFATALPLWTPAVCNSVLADHSQTPTLHARNYTGIGSKSLSVHECLLHWNMELTKLLLDYSTRKQKPGAPPAYELGKRSDAQDNLTISPVADYAKVSARCASLNASGDTGSDDLTNRTTFRVRNFLSQNRRVRPTHPPISWNG
jgi:hypothetical protein